MNTVFDYLSLQNALLYYDGSEKGSREAKEKAKILSEILEGRRVKVLYNPKITNLDPEEFKYDWALACALAKKLIKYAKLSMKVTIFVYGPEAELIELSLIKLKRRERERITLHSFGSTLISNRFAYSYKLYIWT